MATLRLFATVRVAAGTGRATFPGDRVSDVLDAANAEYGAEFAELVEHCRIWVNGAAADPETPIGDADEVALLPPVSGG